MAKAQTGIGRWAFYRSIRQLRAHDEEPGTNILITGGSGCVGRRPSGREGCGHEVAAPVLTDTAAEMPRR